MNRYSSVSVALLLVVAAADTVAAQSINDRKASARATITGSNRIYDGTFVATGIAMICGEVPKERSLTGTAVFNIEYPLDAKDTDQIQSISFGSTELVNGKTRATKFSLNISVRLPNGSKPYPYVLITDAGRPGNSGVATLTKNNNKSIELNVAGKSERKETISLKVTCQ